MFEDLLKLCKVAVNRWCSYASARKERATCHIFVLLNREFYDLDIIRGPFAHLVSGIAR